MSFFNKIIDKAKPAAGTDAKTLHVPSETRQTHSARSFFGLHTPQSSVSSSTHSHEPKHQRTSTHSHHHEPELPATSGVQAEQGEKPKTQDESSHSQTADTMDVDQAQSTSNVYSNISRQPTLKQRYQQYDKDIMDQRKNRAKLKLDDFHLLRTLGTGSFGRVHLSQSRHNNRFYAIKVLKKSEVVRLKQVEHTNNEKKILETVANPFLVNMWGTFQDDACLYMVMDYVPGGELFSVLRRCKHFPDHVAKFYAAEVCLAIEYLHTKDIVYRDLKPENLLLDTQGHIKITDFGFAKYVPDNTWTLCGTPDYLAPEVIQSKGYGKAVDWWSLGVLIFEMLAGYPPFYDDDHIKLYEKILQGKIRWPSSFEANAKDLLKRLLTADLSRRFGNLKNGAEDIKRHLWFGDIDFDLVANRKIRAPYVPHIRCDGDASHFDKYPETTEPYGLPGPDPYRELFADF